MAKRRSVRQYRTLFLLLILASSTALHSADNVVPQSGLNQPVLSISRVSHAPRLDDFTGMKPGPSAPALTKVSGFLQREPKDGASAQEETDVYIGYDAKNFYAIFVCFDRDPHRIRARMVHRE